MSRPPSTRALLAGIVALAFLYGLWGRWESCEKIRALREGEAVELSRDEIVFLTLRKNLKQGWSHYHVQSWARAEKAAGRPVPPYLEEPFLKYPPLFALMLGGADAPGLAGLQKAFLLMAGIGALVSLAVFGVARSFLDPAWSAAAAAIAWVDPVLWAGSVKVWSDLPLALFCTGAVWACLRAARNPRWYPAAGFLLGLAFLTKYPAVLAWAALFGWCGIARRDASSRWFWLGAALPWAMLLPWLLWGAACFGAGISTDELSRVFRIAWANAGWLAAVAAVTWAVVWLRAGPAAGPVAESRTPRDERLFWGLFTVMVVGLFCFPSWFSGRIEPRAGIQTGFFAEEGRGFYFERLASLDPLLWPGLIALLVWRPPPEADGCRWVALAWLLFFSFWENYQSRYIMPAVPLLCVLSAWALREIVEGLRSRPERWLERAWLTAWIIFACLRLDWIHQKMNVPNAFTYF